MGGFLEASSDSNRSSFPFGILRTQLLSVLFRPEFLRQDDEPLAVVCVEHPLDRWFHFKSLLQLESEKKAASVRWRPPSGLLYMEALTREIYICEKIPRCSVLHT